MTKQSLKPVKERRTVSTMSELADFCGVSTNTIATWKKNPGFPIEDNGEYSPFRIGQWHAMRMVSPNKPSIPTSSDDDEDDEMPLVASPALERCREERYKLLKMEREERENGLIVRDQVHSFMMRIASLLRRWSDRVQRQFGDEFYQATVDVLQDIQKETEREFDDEADDDAIPE